MSNAAYKSNKLLPSINKIPSEPMKSVGTILPATGMPLVVAISTPPVPVVAVTVNAVVAVSTFFVLGSRAETVTVRLPLESDVVGLYDHAPVLFAVTTAVIGEESTIVRVTVALGNEVPDING